MDAAKIIKNGGILVWLLFLIFFQLSFIGALARPWSQLNLILVFIFFVVLLVNYQLGLYLAAVAGLILEVYSPLFFGGIIFPLLGAVLLINFLFKLFFTNRSLYSLLSLSLLGLGVYSLFNFIYLNLAFWLGWQPFMIELTGDYFANLGWQAFFLALILTLVFIPLRLFSRRFKSVYLVEGRR
ncbi:MAG: hypothetical protein WCT37_04870 [Patescibacteria group bacterium]|jgi:hypothetical protein